MYADSSGSPSCLCRVYEKELSDVLSEESPSWVLSCDAMTNVVLLQTVHKVLRRKHV